MGLQWCDPSWCRYSLNILLILNLILFLIQIVKTLKLKFALLDWMFFLFWIENVFFSSQKVAWFLDWNWHTAPVLHDALCYYSHVYWEICNHRILSSHFPESLFAQSIACTSSLNIYLGPDDQSQMLFRNMLEKGGGWLRWCVRNTWWFLERRYLAQ